MRFSHSHSLRTVARPTVWVETLYGLPRAVLTRLDLRVPMGLVGATQRLRSRWKQDRQVAHANELLPGITAQAAGRAGGMQWKGLRVISTVTDVTVVALGQEGRSPEALLKLANSEQAAADLRNQSRVLSTLRADPRLRGWNALLPDLLAEGQAEGQYYVVETVLPGVDARRVLNEAGARSRMLAGAAETISQLHTRTASLRPVDARLLNEWIDRRVKIVRGSLTRGTRQNRYTEKLDGLAGELYRSFVGREVPVGWIHGDFGPGNLLVSPTGEPVTGVVDWGLASPEDFPLLDLVHMLLSMRMYLEGRELGDIICQLLDGGAWTREEMALLNAEQKLFSSQPVDTRSLLLLAWLRHIASNLSKSRHYAKNWLWVDRNVKRVLAAL